MSNEDLEKLLLLLIKLAGLIIIVFNAGVGLILLRQVITINNVVKVKSGFLFLLMILIFLVVTSFLLLYAIAI